MSTKAQKDEAVMPLVWSGFSIAAAVVLWAVSMGVENVPAISGSVAGLIILAVMLLVPFVISGLGVGYGYVQLKKGAAIWTRFQKMLIWAGVLLGVLVALCTVSIWLMILEAVLS